ncbi:hypothetical protein [Rhabdaerophilum sp. SD176]|uniref:hypothetical protein n=1 Tax=Rhabdaerophilum sp. SD176 TaxID=2983548 RepID=UPI0024DF549A|nr:hypothetical protein [Rhabdaerophilum sp. SD176]
MSALLRMPVSPVIETVGLPGCPASLAEQLDARAFLILESRAQAEDMIREDMLQGHADTEWTAYFVEAMVEYLVWQKAPAGRIGAEDLAWLVDHLAGEPSPSMPALLFALVRELNDVPEALTALALKHSRNRLRGWH